MNSRVEQALYNMTDEELLETVIYPRDGQYLKVYTNSYILVDGNTRYYEMIRRMRSDPNGLFNSGLQTPVEILCELPISFQATKERSKMVKDEEFYLLMLERLLLEIRNMDDSQLSNAKSLAYIFHNLPGVLRCDFDEETAEEAYEVIRSRAEFFGLSKQIEEWEQSAFERIEFEQLQKQLQPS